MHFKPAAVRALVAAIAVQAAAAHADVTAGLREVGGLLAFGIILSGDIEPSDAVTFGALAAEAPANAVRMVLPNTKGGDVAAAMDIGRILRNEGFNVVILPGAECFSSCVFILAAGIDKRVQGSVGIHRPYFVAATEGSVADAIKETKEQIEVYLGEMNIPLRLAEDMFSVDPADMRLLNERELSDYRLNSMDYTEREAQALSSAEKYGLSRSAYEAFRADLNRSCQAAMANPTVFKLCAAEVILRHGVNIPEGWFDVE